MSKIVKEVEASNLNYADDFGSKKDLKSKPARRFAILTCMDARLDPAKFAGLVEGDDVSYTHLTLPTNREV